MAGWRNNRNATGKTEEMLDRENQEGVEQLSSKISRLKGIASGLETDAKDHNVYIDDMTSDFSSTQGLLSGSFHRINAMVKSGKGNRKMMCYLILGIVVLFFLAYYLISKVTR